MRSGSLRDLMQPFRQLNQQAQERTMWADGPLGDLKAVIRGCRSFGVSLPLTGCIELKEDGGDS